MAGAIHTPEQSQHWLVWLARQMRDRVRDLDLDDVLAQRAGEEPTDLESAEAEALADLGAAVRSAGAVIGPNSTLIFDIELISVQ